MQRLQESSYVDRHDDIKKYNTKHLMADQLTINDSDSW